MSYNLKSLWYKTREGFFNPISEPTEVGLERSWGLELGKCRKVSSTHYHGQCFHVSPNIKMSFSIPNNTDTDALVSTCASHRDSRVLTLLFCSPDTHWSFSPQPPSILTPAPEFMHEGTGAARGSESTQMTVMGLAGITTAFQRWPLSLNQTAASWSLLPFGWLPPPLPTQSLNECPLVMST